MLTAGLRTAQPLTQQPTPLTGRESDDAYRLQQDASAFHNHRNSGEPGQNTVFAEIGISKGFDVVAKSVCQRHKQPIVWHFGEDQ